MQEIQRPPTPDNSTACVAFVGVWHHLGTTRRWIWSAVDATTGRSVDQMPVVVSGVDQDGNALLGL